MQRSDTRCLRLQFSAPGKFSQLPAQADGDADSDSITALAAASMLPRNYDVTVVARDLPGDSDTRGWSSPNAGAIFMGMAKCSEHDQKLQMDSFWVWWRQALQNPESSVRRIEMQDLIDGASLESVWYAGKFPEFRVMSADEMPKDADFGMSYQSIIITPSVYLVWLRRQLEASGVKFIRAHVKSLSELRGMGHDVLVNATGTGAAHLRDVADPLMEEVRGQTILVKSPFDKIWARRGKDYTYAFGRPDGTTILGGIKQYGNTDTSVYETDRTDVSPSVLKFRDVSANMYRSANVSTIISRRTFLHRTPKTWILSAISLVSAPRGEAALGLRRRLQMVR